MDNKFRKNPSARGRPKGFKLTEETKKKLSLSKMGSKNPMFGKKSWNRGLKGVQVAWNKGKRMSTEQKEKISKNRTGKMLATENPEWKGEKVSYRGLHRWVQKNFGTPCVCEFCKKRNLTGRKIHWANKSGLYKRYRTDWLRLCGSCHGAYDKKNGLRKYNKTTI